MDRPTESQPTWAESGVTVAPPAGKMAQGWAPGDAPPAQWLNFIYRRVRRWTRFVIARGDALVTAAGMDPTAEDSDDVANAVQAILERSQVRLAVGNWDPVDSGTNRNMVDMDLGNDVIVAAANGGYIIRSTDGGLTWAEVDVAGVGANLTAVAYGDGVWIAVGFMGSSPTVIRSTDDGQTWSVISSGVPSENFSGVAFGNGTFIIVGDAGTVIRSTDGGQNWSAVGSVPSFVDLTAIAFGNGVFLAVGPNGRIYRSADDGDTWTEPDAGGTPSFLCAKYADGRWMLGAEAGAISTSEDDGQSWSSVDLPDFLDVNALAWLQGAWAAICEAGTVMTSLDGGTSWESHGSDFSVRLSSAVTSRARIVAAGVTGVVTRSLRLPA